MSISVVEDVSYKVKKFVIFGFNTGTDVAFKLRSYLRLDSISPTPGNVKTRLLYRKYLKDPEHNNYRYYASDDEIVINSTNFVYDSDKNGSVMHLTQSEFGKYCADELWVEYIKGASLDHNIFQVTEAYNFYISSIAFRYVLKRISELLSVLKTPTIKYYDVPDGLSDDKFNKLWISIGIGIATQRVSTSIIDWVNGLGAKSIYLEYLDGGDSSDYISRYNFAISQNMQSNLSKIAINRSNFDRALNLLILKRLLPDFHAKFNAYLDKNRRYVMLGDFMNTSYDDSAYDISDKNIRAVLGKRFKDFEDEKASYNVGGTPCSHYKDIALLKNAKPTMATVAAINKHSSKDLIYGFIKCKDCNSILICPHMLERISMEARMGMRNSTVSEQTIKDMLKTYVSNNGTKNTCNICGAMFGDLSEDVEQAPEDNDVRRQVWEICAFSMNSITLNIFVNRKTFINSMFLIVLGHAKHRRTIMKVSDEKIKTLNNKNLQLYVYAVMYAYVYVYKTLVLTGNATFKGAKNASDEFVSKLCVEMMQNELSVNTIDEEYVKKEMRNMKGEYATISAEKSSDVAYIEFLNEVCGYSLYTYAERILFITKNITDEEEVFKRIMGDSPSGMYKKVKELSKNELFKTFSNTVGITQTDWDLVKINKNITLNQHFVQLSGVGRMFDVYNSVRTAFNTGDINACRHLLRSRVFNDPSQIMYNENYKFVDTISELSISYDENGLPHNWDIYVFEGGEVKGYKNIYNARMKNQQLGKLIDHKCTLCGIEYSKCKTLNDKTISDKLNDIAIMDSLFVYYITTCPEGDVHKGDPCTKCGLDSKVKDEAYYKKYIDHYLKSTTFIIEYKKPNEFRVKEPKLISNYELCLRVAQKMNIDIQLINSIGTYEYRYSNKLLSNVDVPITHLVVLSAWNAYHSLFVKCSRFLNGVKFGDYEHTYERVKLESAYEQYELMTLSKVSDVKCHKFIIERICELIETLLTLSEDAKYVAVAKMFMDDLIAKQKLLCITVIETDINSEDLIDYDEDYDEEIDEAVDENEIPETE